MLEDRETHIDKTGPREIVWVLGVGAVLLLSLLIKLVI